MEYNETKSYAEKRPAGMAVAALVLGICGTVFGLCPYTGLILGSLAVILGLISRGGEMKMMGQAKAGVILGCIGMGISCIVFIIAIAGGSFSYIHYQTEYSNSRNYQNYDDTFDDYNYDYDYDYDLDDYNYDDTF